MSKSPDNHYWFPPIANVSLFPNLTVPGLNNVAVRQAMAYAIDRNQVSQIGEYGYEPPANQTGIVTPTFSQLVDTSAREPVQLHLQPGQGEADPDQRGLQDGQRTGSSPRAASSCRSRHQHRRLLRLGRLDAGDPAGAEGGRHRGHARQPVAERLPVADCTTGNYQLAYNAADRRPDAVLRARQWLYSANSAPIGKHGVEQLGAVQQPGDRRAAQPVRARPPTRRTQHAIVDQLQQVMLSDVPFIPVTEEVDWYQYNTGKFTGWPTPSDPYAHAGRVQLPRHGPGAAAPRAPSSDAEVSQVGR